MLQATALPCSKVGACFDPYHPSNDRYSEAQRQGKSLRTTVTIFDRSRKLDAVRAESLSVRCSAV